MVFLVIVFFVLAMIGAVSYIDNANVQKIETFLDTNGCYEINYTRGVYQGLCDKKVVIMKNGFKIDLNTATMISYASIQKVQTNEKELVLYTKKQPHTLKFMNNEDRDKFQRKLEEDAHK